MRWRVQVSVMSMLLAHKKTVTTIVSPSQINSECRIYVCLLSVYLNLNNQLWSLTNPSLEHWLWWVAQVPTLLVFYTNYSTFITGCCLLKTENDTEMTWIVEASILPMFFAHRRIAATMWSPLQMIWLSSTGCFLLNTENELTMMRIVKVSVALTIFAHSLIFPTTPIPTHMNSACMISAFLLNVYFLLKNQLWSLRNPSLEHWL